MYVNSTKCEENKEELLKCRNPISWHNLRSFFFWSCVKNIHDLPNFAFPKIANATHYFRTVQLGSRSISLTRRHLTVSSRTESFCSVAGHNILIRHAENAVCFSSLTEVEDRRPPKAVSSTGCQRLKATTVYVLWHLRFFKAFATR